MNREYAVILSCIVDTWGDLWPGRVNSIGTVSDIIINGRAMLEAKAIAERLIIYDYYQYKDVAYSPLRPFTIIEACCESIDRWDR